MRRIDADALKDKLQQHHDFYVMAWGGFGKMPIGEKKRVDEITNCIAEVVNAPTIEPKRGEWIPCSERLPKERLFVLVCFEEIYGLPSIGITYYNKGKWEDALYREVVAWMPLPKPYKESE